MTSSIRVAPAFPSFVSVSVVDTGRPVPPCEYCGVESGLVGVHWQPGYDSTITGLLQVCPECTESAVVVAVADCLPNTVVRVELDLYAERMPIPLRSAA